MSAINTDAHRRLALQLALQLPENIADARHVLALSSELLEGFLVEPQSARRRALRLGWRLESEGGGDQKAAGKRAGVAWSTLWGLCSLLVSVPIALLLIDWFGVGGGLTFAFAVTMVALVMDTIPALVLALVTPPLHNFFLVSPALEFSKPSSGQVLAAMLYLLLALGVPFVAARRANIRAAIPRLPPAPEPCREWAPLKMVDKA